MKKILTFLSALLLGSACAVAQTTAVTATVVDSDSTVWANAPWSLSFQVGPNQSNPAAYIIGGSPLSSSVTQQSGAANASGVITFTVYRSTSVSPIGSSWNLNVCPNASSRCASFNFSTSGATQNLSGQINASIIAPRFQAVSGSYGYNDSEAMLQLKPASTYWNVTNSVSRCYTGSAWGVCSAGGSGSGTVSSATAGKIAGYGTTGTTVVGVTPYGPMVTDPPYLAKCDGVSDDTTAFQAAIDANPAIQLPLSIGTNFVQCNVTNLIQNNQLLQIFFNGSILFSSITDSSAIFSSTVSGAQFIGYNGFFQLASSGITGNPAEFNGTNYNSVQLFSVDDGGSPGQTYDVIRSTGSVYYFLSNYGGYGNINVTGAQALISNTLFSNTGTSINVNAASVIVNDLLVQGNADFTNTGNISLNGTVTGTLTITGVHTISGSLRSVGALVGTATSGSFCYSSTCVDYSPRTFLGLQSGGMQSISGCSLTSAVGGASSGSFHSGVTGTCTVTFTPGFTATNGFSCWTNDMTTPTDHIPQTAYNSTTATISGTTVSGDVITWGCIAF